MCMCFLLFAKFLSGQFKAASALQSQNGVKVSQGNETMGLGKL